MGKISSPKLKPSQRHYKDANGTHYERTNRKTGKSYSVTLRHPCKTSTEKQTLTRSKFGTLNSLVNKWISENKGEESEAYQKVMTKFKRQDKYKLLRGFMIGTNMATMSDDSTVVIRIDDYSVVVNVD